MLDHRGQNNYLVCNSQIDTEKTEALKRFIFSCSLNVNINLLTEYIAWLNSALMRCFILEY